MATFEIVSRSGKAIRSVKEWGVVAKPTKAEHWQDGRSAKELAKAWISGRGPTALISLLDLDHATAGLRIEYAAAEAQTAFDRWPGGRRNHDLLVVGEAAGGKTVVGLEGKADETFGQKVSGYREAALRREQRGKSTNALARLDELTMALAGSTLKEEPMLGDLRYQLFSGVAGTLAAAEAALARQAAFVVHEFITDRTTERLHKANAAALTAFIVRLFGSSPPSESSWLLGPANVPAARWSELPFWIGKITSDCRGCVQPKASARHTDT